MIKQMIMIVQKWFKLKILKVKCLLKFKINDY